MWSNFIEEFFSLKSISKEGLTPHCKPCAKVYRRKYYEKIYDLEKKYRSEKKDSIKQYYLENRDKSNSRKKKFEKEI